MERKVSGKDQRGDRTKNDAMALDEGRMGRGDSAGSGASGWNEDQETSANAPGGYANGTTGGTPAAPGPASRSENRPPAAPVATTMPPPPPPAPPRVASPAHRSIDTSRPEPPRARDNDGILDGEAGEATTGRRRHEFRGNGGGGGNGQGEALALEQPREAWPPANKPAALTGDLETIEHALAKHDIDGALGKARDWHARDPGNVLALIGLGDALEAKGSLATASRVYGSIIDLFPGRADMRRFAGERLARIAARTERPSELVIDTYRRAVADRPDHMTGHRLLAYALVRAGKLDEAFAAILAGIDQPYPPGRFAGGERTLADDVGMIAAAYLKASPSKAAEIKAELAKRNLTLPNGPSTRFILYWETDANDVDFHIQDARGGHAFYGSKALPSGGELYADITTGYGPECFAINGAPTAGPYRLSIDYFSQGPMGYGMGLLEIQRFDGKGTLTFEDRPYVIMNDHAFVDLGTFK
jgi:hypothetical protein